MLGVAVIACNEADRIADCLASVPFATERVVVDSGSTDSTIAVAESCGARVIRTDWPGFVVQKNRALDELHTPWVLCLDADERLSEEAASSLEEAIGRSGPESGFSFSCLSHWLGTPIRHGWWYPDRKTRVIRKGRGRWTGAGVHETLQVDGCVRPLQGDLIHLAYRDFSEHLATIDRYSALHADGLLEAGIRARWVDVALRPPLHFLQGYLLKRGFLDGVPGVAVAGLGAAHVLAKWARVWHGQDAGA